MAKPNKLTKQVPVLFPEEEYEQVTARAAAEQRSVSNCIRNLVRLGLSAANQQQPRVAA